MIDSTFRGQDDNIPEIASHLQSERAIVDTTAVLQEKAWVICSRLIHSSLSLVLRASVKDEDSV
jgi:hypothetical protein